MSWEKARQWLFPTRSHLKRLVLIWSRPFQTIWALVIPGRLGRSEVWPRLSHWTKVQIIHCSPSPFLQQGLAWKDSIWSDLDHLGWFEAWSSLGDLGRWVDESCEILGDHGRRASRRPQWDRFFQISTFARSRSRDFPSSDPPFSPFSFFSSRAAQVAPLAFWASLGVNCPSLELKHRCWLSLPRFFRTDNGGITI